MRISPTTGLLVPVAPLLALALLAPLAWLFKTALVSGEPWTVDGFFWHVLRFTYLQAALSATLSVAFGGLGAWLLVENGFEMHKRH